MINKIARLISWILSPLLIPAYGTAMSLWLTAYSAMPHALLWRVTAVVWTITCLVPMIAILVLWATHFVTDLGLNKRRERPVPYVLTVICYIVAALYLSAAHAPQWMWLFMVAGAGAALVSFVVNFWWKISAHMAAMGGLLALTFRMAADHLAVVDTWPVITAVILLTGLLGTCRIQLHCHTLAQVFAGTANGFLWVWVLTI